MVAQETQRVARHERGPMKLSNLVLPLLLSFTFQPEAFGLEPSPSVTVSTVLKAQTSWDGKPIAYPAGKPEVTGMVIEIAPGAETGWHSHPVPSFAMVLQGELEVRLKSGAVKRLKAGDALAEVVDTLHNGRAVGSVPARIVVFYVGSVGQKLSVKESAE